MRCCRKITPKPRAKFCSARIRELPHRTVRSARSRVNLLILARPINFIDVVSSADLDTALVPPVLDCVGNQSGGEPTGEATPSDPVSVCCVAG